MPILSTTLTNFTHVLLLVFTKSFVYVVGYLGVNRTSSKGVRMTGVAGERPLPSVLEGPIVI